MNKRHISSISGFTIVEVLLTAAIIGVIAATGYGFNFFVDSYNLGRDTSLLVFVHGDLQTRAMIGLEYMVRGVDDYKGLQEAQDVTLPTVGGSGNTITFVSKEDSLSRQFRLTGDRLEYINEGGLTIVLIDSDVQTLTFNRPINMDDLIEITLVLQRVALGQTVTANLSTSVRLRNM